MFLAGIYQNTMEQIIQLLSKDFRRNINILYFAEQYPVTCIKVKGDSVLLKGTSDREWVMISSECVNELIPLLRELTLDNKCFSFLEDWIVPYITHCRDAKWMLSTSQYDLPDDIILPQKKHTTEKLNPDDADFILTNSNYGQYLSNKYIMDRINRAPSSCIRIYDQLAAWCFTHDDMAIGSLHVLPEFRKHGFAASVLADIIEQVRGLGKVPFCYIEPQNGKSINLVTKLGFRKGKSVVWLELE